MRACSGSLWVLLSCALPLAWHGCGSKPAPADLVLRGGKIITMDPDRGEVAALAARGGTIVAMGTDEQILPFIGPGTQVIELRGRVAVPGFIEGHGHFTALGRSLMNVDLKGARTWEDVVARVGQAASRAEPGHWILGRGWHQEKWDRPVQPAVEGYPIHELLSRASPANPVLLEHASGHAALANALALERAGIDSAAPDPSGGRIVRDASGQPTGVLLETAAELVERAHAEDQARRSPDEIEQEARREIELADRECVSKGLTSFQDAGSDFATVDRLRALAQAGQLGIRLWVMLREDNDALERRIRDYRITDAAGGHLTVRAIKRSIDGALGSRGAWLLEPYSDWPDGTGLNTTPVAELERTARIAIDNGFQLCVHAIGDRANREVLDLYERTFAGRPDAAALRWRVEHAQHLGLQDIPRFAELGVIASMQAIHCTSDAPWVPERLGPRRSEEGAYVWRKLLDSGAVISNGTDAPVEDVDPIANFYAAVTRKLADGQAFHPEQRMTRMEALESYTIRAAFAAFEEQGKGSLAPGKLADITVLSQDLLSVPEEQILGTRVLLTVVGGRVVYDIATLEAAGG